MSTPTLLCSFTVPLMRTDEAAQQAFVSLLVRADDAVRQWTKASERHHTCDVTGNGDVLTFSFFGHDTARIHKHDAYKTPAYCLYSYTMDIAAPASDDALAVIHANYGAMRHEARARLLPVVRPSLRTVLLSRDNVFDWPNVVLSNRPDLPGRDVVTFEFYQHAADAEMAGRKHAPQSKL